MRDDLSSEVQILASEVFNRCWQFIENDPVLAGNDRQRMQDHLAQLIFLLLRDGERNLIVVANRVIGMLRQQHSVRSYQVEEAA